MSANTSFSSTNSKLNLFISKQTITNNQVISDLSSTEFPLIEIYPIFLNREYNNKLTKIGVYECNSTGQSGYLTSLKFNEFSGKLSNIVSGTNIYATPTGVSPTVSLAISSTVDMSNQSLTNLLNEDFKSDIDIRQSGYKRIYNSGTNLIISPSGDLIFNPSSKLSINSNMNMNSKTLDMSGGSITGISNENFSKEIDIQLKGKKFIYTTNGSNLSIDGSGSIILQSPIDINGKTLNMSTGNILGIDNQYFKEDLKIYYGLIPKKIIYTDGNNISIDPDGMLKIGSQLDMSSNQVVNISYEDYKQNIDIRQGGVQRIYTIGNNMTISPQGNLTIAPTTGNFIINSTMDIQNDVSMNGRTLDMESGFITGISNENYKTDIDIRQNGSKRIYTTGNVMSFDTSGLNILSDVSMNGRTLDMESGFITGISNENYKTDIDIRQNGSKRIYTTGNVMSFDTSGLNILSDVSMNGRTLDMESGFITGISYENYKTDIDIRQNGSKRIYTASDGDLYLDPIGNVNLAGNTLDMANSTIIDVSGLYSISGEILRIDASNISFTYGKKTHVVIDNCGIILNDISSNSTGTVLTFNSTTNRVSYYPLYDTSSFLIDLSGITNAIPFTMKISHIGNTVTMGIPDVSGIFSTSTSAPYINTKPAIDVKYRPTSNIYFPALVYTNGIITNGKILLRNDGYMQLYNNVYDISSSWIQNIRGGMVSQCFTYHTF